MEEKVRNLPKAGRIVLIKSRQAGGVCNDGYSQAYGQCEMGGSYEALSYYTPKVGCRVER